MLFTSTKINNLGADCSLHIGSETLIRQMHAKFLDLIVGQQLTWHAHINYCKTKLLSALYAINKIKAIVPVEVLRMVYFSLVHPHLAFGMTLWGAVYNIHVNKIHVMEKRIVRAIFEVEYSAHTAQRFDELRILN